MDNVMCNERPYLFCYFTYLFFTVIYNSAQQNSIPETLYIIINIYFKVTEFYDF